MTINTMEFINEVGNRITVRSGDTMIAGVRGVKLTIEGPTSKTENTMTLAEAEAVRTVLSDYHR